MEFEHALSELVIRDDLAVIGDGNGAGKARLNFYFATIYAAEKRANHSLLAFLTALVVIEDV